MDAALIGTRLASAAISPLLKKLLVSDAPGAGLTGNAPKVRLSGLVSFRGEKRTLTEKDVRKLAATLVERSRDDGGEAPFPADETEALAHTLGTTLLALGDLDMDDVQAVRLGHQALARRLRAAAPAPDGLSTDSVRYLESLTEWACLHILDFFTQRSTFIARSLVEQTRGQTELIAKLDELIRRTPRPDGRDTAFERRYLDHLAKKHGRLTIYGIDLHHSPDDWPLDLAYLSLEATGADAALRTLDGAGRLLPQQREHAAPVRADLALARHDRILLRGLAGSGKTTLVQWLTVSAATEGRTDGMGYLRGRVPFVLPLRTLTRHGERLPAPGHFLAAAGCPLAPPDGWTDRVLASGRGLVLVDGIDEIPEAERGRARAWLRDLLTTYEGNRWLVTSRPTAVGDDWLARDGFTELTLAPMTRTEVTTFVRRWHCAAGPGAAAYEQPLLDALRTTEHVAQLATNPLMCGLICALHRDRHGYLPRGRKALYEAALSMLLSRRDRERDMGTPYGITLDEAPQIQLIQRIAYWLTLNGRTQMDRAHAKGIVSDALPSIQEAAAYDPDTVFTHLLHRSGLLREPTPDTVEFVHRTFQEYLAAKALVEHWDIGVLIRHAADDQWEDVVRMAVGHARPRECAEILHELLAAADATRDRTVRLRLVLLAATALSHATEVATDIREDVLRRTAEVIPPRTPREARELAGVGPMVLGLMRGPEDPQRLSEALMSVITMTWIGGEAPLPYLARYATHPSLAVRSQVIWGWHRFETRLFAEEVVARLDPTDLDFTVGKDDEALELERLDLHPPRLSIGVSVSDDQASALLARCTPTHLQLGRSGSPARLLASLDRLTTLNLNLVAGATWSVADLPASVPLAALDVSCWPADGLRDPERLRHLTTLDVTRASALTPEQWRELSAVPALKILKIDAEDLPWCPDDVVLPGIEELTMMHDDDSGFALLARMFPSVQSIELDSHADEGEAMDIEPFSDLPLLTTVFSNGPLAGQEYLPDRVRFVDLKGRPIGA
ncbi:NACHT domain-containing protein [Streptomyces sp. NPDC056361]|uniref:NACHT domain-containing protein n=1 Tax=Streptomyces sp. NPDC056361 TaxID=3345795 RepID=UPI0035DA13E0